MEIKLKPYQADFFESQKRFPAIISAVGTGKTFMLLLKIWEYCEKYPDSLALIIRKEFTDLRDSTLKDFTTYFGVTVNTNKEYKFPNGSTIMFRHGAELAILKNMNLSIAGIEQAEEFDSDEVFTYLRDRLRRQNAPYRQLCVIANANGHNWLWHLFINGSEIQEIYSKATGQIVRTKGEEYLCCEANTFANESNLPDDFIKDHKEMQYSAPNHYMRYVMNSHDEIDADDLLFVPKEIYDAPNIVIPYEHRSIKRVMGVDVARYGQDKTVFTIIEQKDIYRWEQVFLEAYNQTSVPWTAGYACELERKFDLDLMVVDDIGVGGGVTDLLTNNRVLPFIANSSASASKARQYEDSKTEAYFMLEELVRNGWIKLLDDLEQQEQLTSIRFKYKGVRKVIVGKEEMRAKYKELKSPDKASALSMAVFGTTRQINKQEHINLPRYGQTDVDISTTGRQDFSTRNLPRQGIMG